MRHRLLRALSMAAIACSLLIVACGSDGGSSDAQPVVRPFSEIQASDFTFENDPLVPDQGVFHVTTTEPSICALIWGPTEALGRFNNSLAMNGTGIEQHDVALPGAVAGETYFFRVQGSTANGNLYQSELGTFTLPERPAAASGANELPPGIGENIAPTATITEVSSEFSAAWAATNAIDDNPATEWSSKGDGGNAFITLDLGESRQVAGVEFETRSMADGSAITTTYSVVVDGEERYGPFPAATPAQRAVQAVQFKGQVLRFEVEDTTGGNTGAIEIRVFAPAQ